MFFDRVYRPENVVADEADGLPVAALYLLPYSMALGNREMPLAYVAGVATDPARRGRGRMSRLMDRALCEMRRRGDALSALIPAEPWLFGFYRRWGYAEAVFYRPEALLPESIAHECRSGGSCVAAVPAGAGVLTVCRADDPFAGTSAVFPVDVLFAAFHRLQRLRAFGIRHSRAEFEVILRDLFLGGGDLFLGLDAERAIRALAFVYPAADGSQLVKELLSDSAGARLWLERRLPAMYPSGESVFLRRPVASGGVPFGMLRVIDAERVLSWYASAHPEAEWRIELHDPGLPANSGRFRLAGGCCRRVCGREAERTFRPVGCGELPALLFGGETVHLSLMLD